jgi:hypothetical protein
MNTQEAIIHLNVRGKFMDVPRKVLISVEGSLLHEWFSGEYPYAVQRHNGDPYVNFDFVFFEQVIEILTSKQWQTVNSPFVPSPSFYPGFAGEEFLRMVDHLGLKEIIFPFGVFKLNEGPEHELVTQNIKLLQKETIVSTNVDQTFRLVGVYGNKKTKIKSYDIVLTTFNSVMCVGWKKKSLLYPMNEFQGMEPLDNDAYVGELKDTIGYHALGKKIRISGRDGEHDWYNINDLDVPDIIYPSRIKCAAFGRCWFVNDKLVASVAGGAGSGPLDIVNIPDKFFLDGIELEPCFTINGSVCIENVELVFADEDEYML